MKRSKLIFDFLKNYKKYIIKVQIIEVLQIIATACLPYINSRLIDEGIGGGNIFLIFRFLILYVLLEIFNCFLSNSANEIGFEYNCKCEKDLKTKILHYFIWNNSHKSIGEIDTIISKDISNFLSLFAQNILKLFFSFIKIVVYWSIAVYINKKLTLICLVLTVILLLYNYKNDKLRKKESCEIHEGYVSITRVFHEIIQNLKELRMIGGAEYALEKYRMAIDNLNYRVKKIFKIGQKSAIFSRLHSLSIDGVFWGIGGLYIVNGNMTIGILVSFMGYYRYALSEMSNVIALYSNYAANYQSVDSVIEVLDNMNNVQKTTNGTLCNVDNITFKDYSFKYQNSTDYLYENINITFGSDKINYIVGKSGVGKTTLIKCIIGECDDYSGEILFDNLDIRDLNMNGVLPELVSWVPQEPIIFTDTIKNNITLGKEYEEEWILENCKLCQIYEDIIGMEKGFDTIIGDNGVKLSGGQKQRIGLVRALIQNKPILLMDEVTSGIDNQNGKKIRDNLPYIRKNKLLIIITHNDKFIIKDSRVFYVHDKKIVEENPKLFKIQ